MTIKATVAECMHKVETGVTLFPWEDREPYGDWLAQTYYHVRHSTRLLAAATARFAFDARGQALHARFGAHIGEEAHHELLAEHDLRALGFALEQFPERHLTRTFYEPQYYKIEHLCPIALIGYIVPLEAAAAALGGAVLERLRSAHGKEAVSFVKVHAHDDPDHLEKAYAAIELAAPDERAIIETNIAQTAAGYAALLAEIAVGRR